LVLEAMMPSCYCCCSRSGAIAATPLFAEPAGVVSFGVVEPEAVTIVLIFLMESSSNLMFLLGLSQGTATAALGDCVPPSGKEDVGWIRAPVAGAEAAESLEAFPAEELAFSLPTAKLASACAAMYSLRSVPPA